MSITDVSPSEIKRVVGYLERELSLTVYGNCVDVEKGLYYGGLMDYSEDDICALRKFHKDKREFTEADRHGMQEKEV